MCKSQAERLVPIGKCMNQHRNPQGLTVIVNLPGARYNETIGKERNRTGHIQNRVDERSTVERSHELVRAETFSKTGGHNDAGDPDLV